MSEKNTLLTETEERHIREEVEGLEKYLTFHLDDELYGLEILKVQEIIGLLSITGVPRTPDYVRGVINLRGKVIPVVDLRKKFGMESVEDSNETCIIVVQVQSGDEDVTIGILVDSVAEVLDIRQDDIEDAPTFGKGVRMDFIDGIGRMKDDVVMLLNIEKAMDLEEIRESVAA